MRDALINLISRSSVNEMCFFQICGLTLATDLDNLAVLYTATLQAIAVSYYHTSLFTSPLSLNEHNTFRTGNDRKA